MHSPESLHTEIYQPVTIHEKIQLSPDITHIRFRESVKLSRPGQYIMVWIPGFDEKPFIISQAAPLEIIVQTRGPFSELITSQNFSHKLLIRGPFGTHFDLPKNTTDAATIVIGTTAGLSSARYLLQSLSSKGLNNIRLFLNEKIFNALPADIMGSFPYQTYTDPDLQSVLQMAVQFSEYLYFLPKAEDSLKTLNEAVTANSRLISAQALFVDSYIACAIGVCGRCADEGFLAGKLSCVEGPVFEVLNRRGL